jgi:hypothetical protein
MFPFGAGDNRRERNGYRRVNPFVMRRSLVLTDEAARHPFLAGLPPHVRAIREEEGEPVPSRFPFRLNGQDVREFAMAYVACLLAVSAYIA